MRSMRRRSLHRTDRLNDIRLTTAEGIDAALPASGADVLTAPMGVAAKLTGKAGAPALSLPVATLADGSRFGITLYTRVGEDMRLLSIGRFRRTRDQRRLPTVLNGPSPEWPRRPVSCRLVLIRGDCIRVPA